jgi:uncharacterized protein (DUF2384 family)
MSEMPLEERIRIRAIEVFNTPEKADMWLTSPNKALDGQTPLDAFKEEGGEQRIFSILGKIEHGIYS